MSKSQPSGSRPPSDRERDTLLGAAFPTTKWSLVLCAQKEGVEAARALNELCRLYWYPIYAYLRCRGYARADAQDLAQGFFLKAISGNLIQSAREDRGSLRYFLLASLKRHITDDYRHKTAEKRGGRAIVLPLECLSAEDRYLAEPADGRDPEAIYLAAWARDLMDRVQQRLRDHYVKSGRGDLYHHLESCLALDDSATPYKVLAERLDSSEAAIRIQVHRMRQRLGKLLRKEIALIVHTPAELDEELAWLAKTLRGE